MVGCVRSPSTQRDHPALPNAPLLFGGDRSGSPTDVTPHRPTATWAGMGDRVDWGWVGAFG